MQHDTKHSSFPQANQFPVRAEPPTGYLVTASDKPADPKYMIVAWIISGLVFGLFVYPLGYLNGWGLVVTLMWHAGLWGVATVFVLALMSGQWPVTFAAWVDGRVRKESIRSQREVILRQIEANEKVQLKQIDADAELNQFRLHQQDAARHAIAEQVQDHSIQQSHSNMLDNYVDATEYEDVLLRQLLVYLTGLYDGDAMENGRIVGGVPWGKNSNVWTPTDKERVKDMLQQAGRQGLGWVVRYDANTRHWYVNVQRFDTPGKLVRVFDAVHTPR